MTDAPLSYAVHIADEAKEMLRAISRGDRRIASRLADLMDDLSTLPHQKGDPLGGVLTGLYSRHAIGNRFRIIYEIDGSAGRIWIISVGIREAGSRRDIYELTKKMKAKRG